MVRTAFTMIELIFALVIMGIVFITLPLVLLNDSENVEQNLMQEAIFASSAKLGQILTYSWDENSPDPIATLSSSDVLGAPNGHNLLDRVGTSDFRLGHVQQALHRRMTPNSNERNASTTLGNDGGDLDDLDDADGTSNVSLISSTSENTYKKNYQIDTNVTYLNDTATYSNSSINYTFDVTNTIIGGQSNIKMIEISTEQNNTAGVFVPILVLRTFSANIGEIDFYKRTY